MTEADVNPVVAFAVDAWAPVFAGSEAVMGPRAYRLVHADWRTAQAAAVTRAVAERGVPLAVIGTGGDRRPGPCTSGTGSPASRWCATTGPCSRTQ
jgi:hypothetical protein